MENTIEIGDEEAATLWSQFVSESGAYASRMEDQGSTDEMLQYPDVAFSHALCLAVARERERCAEIAEDMEMDLGGGAGEWVARKIRGEQ